MKLPVAILAGGLATRLGPLTAAHPKILLEVAGAPFALHQLSILKQSGFTRIVYCAGHLGEQIQELLNDGSRFGMSIDYSFDGVRLLGTGGALKRALPLLGEAFLVLYGDSYLQCDYAAVQDAFLASGRQGLMTVFRNKNQWDRSNVLVADGHVKSYDKRNPSPWMQYIDYGLGALTAGALREFPDVPFDLAEVYEKLVAQNQLLAFEVYERFYEIGSVHGLEELREYLSSKQRNDVHKTIS